MSGAAEPAEALLAGRLRYQAEACGRNGSPLYAGLLGSAAADVEAGGSTWEVLRGHEGDPGPSALALRLMGAVNRLVLAGVAPRLAAIYRDRSPDPAEAWEAFRAALERNSAKLRRLVRLPVQTNEVGRCAALLPGFLAVAAATDLPLRLLEIGASAGLNLRWDRYRYESSDFAWGPAYSPVEIDFEIEGEGGLAGPDRVEVAERLGCDPAPLDPAKSGDRLAMLAYIWPDQTVRVERARAALEAAARTPVELDREPASTWVERRLREQRPGMVTLLYHSMVIQYLREGEPAELDERIRTAGERADAGAPLAWLRMEPAGERSEVWLATWPGGQDRCLARAGYHGSPLELLG